MAVHQFIPSLAKYDAITGHALALRKGLRSEGIESNIFAEFVNDGVDDEVEFYYDFKGGSAADVVIYHAAIGCSIPRFLANRPETLIVNYHNITPPEFFDGWDARTAALLQQGRAQLRELSNKCDLAIAVSEYNARELSNVGYRDVSVLPIVLTQHLVEATGENREDAWLFVGRYSPNKKIEDLLKALYMHKKIYSSDTQLWIVGGAAYENYADSLKEFASRLGLQDDVDFRQSVSPDELADCYSRASVYVSASQHEGFCIPLLEAMSADLPVAAMPYGAVEETLDGCGLLINPPTPTSLAVGAHTLGSNSDIRREAIEAGRQRLKAFDPKTVLSAYLDVLKRYL